MALTLLAALFSSVNRAEAQSQRARTLVYRPEHKEWAEKPPPATGTPEADLHAIRTAIKHGAHRKALSKIKKLSKRVGENHAVLPELLLAKGEALLGARRPYQAHLTIQEFLNRFGGGTLTAEALRIEFVIAESFQSGMKRRWLGIPLLSGEDTAIQIFDEISTNHPESRLAELAIKATADHMFNSGDHALAELEYARLLRDYPQGRYAPFALRRSAEATLASFGGIEYDGAALIEAEERYEDYRRRNPTAARQEGIVLILESIRDARAEKDFSVGAYYDRTGHLSSAVYCYRLVVSDWPGTIAASKAAGRLKLLGAT